MKNMTGSDRPESFPPCPRAAVTRSNYLSISRSSEASPRLQSQPAWTCFPRGKHLIP